MKTVDMVIHWISVVLGLLAAFCLLVLGVYGLMSAETTIGNVALNIGLVAISIPVGIGVAVLCDRAAGWVFDPRDQDAPPMQKSRLGVARPAPAQSFLTGSRPNSDGLSTWRG